MVITSVGRQAGKLRKNPVMRVEHDGAYLAVASKGGAAEDPVWDHNFLAHPEVDLQDGADKRTYTCASCPTAPSATSGGQRAVETWRDVRRVPEEDRPADPGVPAERRA